MNFYQCAGAKRIFSTTNVRVADRLLRRGWTLIQVNQTWCESRCVMDGFPESGTEFVLMGTSSRSRPKKTHRPASPFTDVGDWAGDQNKIDPRHWEKFTDPSWKTEL